MKKIIALAIALAPLSVFAQQITDVNSLTSKLSKIGDTVLVLFISFAIIWIVWSVIRYIMTQDVERSKRGHDILLGIVGLFVILSIWGLVAILSNTFTTQTNVPRDKFPTVPTPPQI